MIRLENEILLYALAAVPLLLLLYLLMLVKRKKLLQSFGEYNMVQRLIPEVSLSKRNLKFALRLVALSLVVIGAANPQLGSKMEEVKREGIDIMILLDVSNSMNAEDIKPSRLEAAKQSISNLLSRIENDRIGLIVFAGRAYTQLPLTADGSAAKLFLSSISTYLFPTQGTAIGAAIKLGISSFPKDDINHRAMVLITDGENHEDDALGAARAADSAGIIMHTIGMGSEEGGPIPITYNGSNVGFKKDQSGQVVLTRLDQALLEQIAITANGKFFRAATGRDPLDPVLKELAKIQKKNFGAKRFTDYEDRFQYFSAAALFLLLIDLLISEKASKLWAKINLFGDSSKLYND